MDKTGLPEISKIWPDSTCVISAWRKGQILLVAGSPVLSTTLVEFKTLLNITFLCNNSYLPVVTQVTVASDVSAPTTAVCPSVFLIAVFPVSLFKYWSI